MRPLRAWLLAVLAAAFPADALAQPQSPSSAETEPVTRALAAWLVADDYQPQELASLAKYGDKLVPSLVAALDAGPSAATRELVRRGLEQEHAALARRARADPERRIRGRAEYVRHYLDNFATLYRIRAAQALAAIGGPSARKALEEALGRPGREDLREAIRRALQKVR